QPFDHLAPGPDVLLGEVAGEHLFPTHAPSLAMGAPTTVRRIIASFRRLRAASHPPTGARWFRTPHSRRPHVRPAHPARLPRPRPDRLPRPHRGRGRAEPGRRLLG